MNTNESLLTPAARANRRLPRDFGVRHLGLGMPMFLSGAMVIAGLLAAVTVPGCGESAPDAKAVDDAALLPAATIMAKSNPDGQERPEDPATTEDSRAGGVAYPDTPVTEAVQTCMRTCADPNASKTDQHTCELLCAQSAWSSAYTDECTVNCMDGFFDCRATCSRRVDKATDVATCSLNCGLLADTCLENRCVPSDS